MKKCPRCGSTRVRCVHRSADNPDESWHCDDCNLDFTQTKKLDESAQDVQEVMALYG